MCTGRVDLSFLLRAFEKGADGVIIGGCWPGECHYVTEGNYDALANVLLGRRLLAHAGLRPERLRIEWIAASEGSRFAEVMTGFAESLRKMGPLGSAEGEGDALTELKLRAAGQIVPYLRLVEREKLRVPVKSERAYEELYDSEEVTRLFETAITDKLVTAEILLLLGGGALSTREIADRLGLTPSEVSRQLGGSSRRGLVRYDVERSCYALA